jgi:cation:H+ antiporter
MGDRATSGVSIGSAGIFVISVAICVLWISMRDSAGELPLVLRTLLPGLAIFGAAFILSWAAEIAQFDVPRALAIAFVALVAVIPEYAVDMYFAWTAGKDPTYTQYATANMTGSNRLLIGLGWASVLFFFWIRTKRRAVFIHVRHRTEMLALLLATLYCFIIPIKGTLTLLDTVILLLIFVGYIRSAIISGVEQPEVEGGIVEMIARLTPWVRRAVALAMFVIAGWSIFAAAKPFAEGLLQVGETFGIEKFILVQWLAPLASESPEFIVAIIFAWRLKPEVGLSTLISSKVNQWTLLIGMLPVAFCVSAGKIHPMIFDARQVEEVFLTAAQSLYALMVIMDLRFSWKDALIIFLLFSTQLLFPHAAVRYTYGAAYIILSIVMIVRSRILRSGLRHTLRVIWRVPRDDVA